MTACWIAAIATPEKGKHMAKQYRLTLGEQTDLTLNRIAQEENNTVSEVLRNAVNTYAMLRSYQHVYVKAPNGQDGRLIVKRIAIP